MGLSDSVGTSHLGESLFHKGDGVFFVEYCVRKFVLTGNSLGMNFERFKSARAYYGKVHFSEWAP